MSTYHKDLDQRIEGERYAGIVIKDKKILLVHIIKNNFEYYVVPGGHKRNGETEQEAVIREVYEESGIKVNNPKEVLRFIHPNNHEKNYYYLCNWIYGNNPHLTGEELDSDPKNDYFQPI